MDDEPSESPESNSTAQISPPIFIKYVKYNFHQLCINIKEIINTEDQFICKTSINGIKLSTRTPNAYRLLIVKFLIIN